MTNYKAANKTEQWFQDDYPGSNLRLNKNTMVAVIHTTEGTDWPSYSGGAVAPHYTGKPGLGGERGKWRAHFPDEKSARALANKSGGVETNTLNCVQFELIGTCDPRNAKRWGGTSRSRIAGRDYVYWPEADDKHLLWVARILADMHRRHGLVLMAPKPFKAYPESYGSKNGVRLSTKEWLNSHGVIGHQHVPENLHGDPGNIDIEGILSRARKLVSK